MTDKKENPEALEGAPAGLIDFDSTNIEISTTDSRIGEDEDYISSDDAGAWGPKQQAEYEEYLARQRKSSAVSRADKSMVENTKPKLLVDRANPDKTIDALADIIANAGEFYDHNGDIVEVISDRNSGLAVIRSVDAGRLILETHKKARPYFIKNNNGTFEDKDTQFPRELAAMYLSSNSHLKLAPLKAIISSPLLGLDGSVDCVNGYHKETGFYLTGVPDVGPMVPMTPMREDAENALQLLREAFKTFAFADAVTVLDGNGIQVVNTTLSPSADESACLTAILTAVVRPNLNLAPALLVHAAETSGAGSGKGKIVRCICAIAYPSQPSAITSGQNGDELEKRITSKLMGHPSCLLLDNMNGLTLKSDLLASVLTENPAETRILGQSRTVLLSSSAFIAATGNGLIVSEDLARRFIEVRFDAKVEDPESREFKGDIVKEISERRPELLAACLTIWRWGLQSLLPKGRALGGFEQWCAWVRDPLLALGCIDPVLRISEAKQNDPHRIRKAEIFQAWWKAHRSQPVTASGVSETVRELLDPQGRGRQYMAKAVSALEGTRIAGFVMSKQRPNGNWGASTYALKQIEDEGPMIPMTPMPVSPQEDSDIDYDFGYSSSVYQSEDSHREHRGHRNVEEKATTIAEPSDDDDWGDT